MAKGNTKFGMRLRELREEAGVSMMQLGKAVGVSDAAVCKWENGLAEPKASYIVKLAEYFDCSADYLVGMDGDFAAERVRARISVKTSDGKAVETSDTEKAELLTSGERELVDTFRGLSADGKKLARAAMDAWASADGKKEKADVKTDADKT